MVPSDRALATSFIQQTSSKLLANFQQTSSKRPALRLLKICWTFAGSCKHTIRLSIVIMSPQLFGRNF